MENKRSEENKKYYCKHKDKCKALMRADNEKTKIKILTAYSDGVIQCKQCGEMDIRILNLDHINGGGRQHQNECRKNRTDVYRELIKQNFPKGFQILCPNCNYLKRCINCEVRKTSGKETEAHRRYHAKLRLEIIAIYSCNLNKCKLCGNDDLKVLCIDHIAGDGCDHRRKTGGSMGVWRDLKKRNYPPVAQILCHNCNRRKMHENKEFGIKFSRSQNVN